MRGLRPTGTRRTGRCERAQREPAGEAVDLRMRWRSAGATVGLSRGAMREGEAGRARAVFTIPIGRRRRRWRACCCLLAVGALTLHAFFGTLPDPSTVGVGRLALEQGLATLVGFCFGKRS
ncbi:hypothetical protein [Nannocystis pusilla]|uniref:Uncharacterized protein n=1 Tax=Nannocystis pusilla TaxID=889268 RepID=A0ABS7TW37_9BACT|nr:hypothetical protein [Nannocystis pusilla]MBZ5712468.1 hypothetical protein [Nannocystis pusilla]